MINKSDSRCAVVRFCYHSYDYRPNWTSLSLITITDFFYLYLSQYHLLYNLHSLQKVIHWRDKETPGDRFREHLRDVENNASKPVARHFNVPNHSKQQMAVIDLSLHQTRKESRKTLEQNKVFFKSSLVFLTVSKNAFHSTNLFCYFSRY